MSEQTPTRERLIRLIRDTGGATLADLRGQTGLARSTLRQHLARLAQSGVVESVPEKRSSGRPPSVYRLTHRAALATSATYLTFLQAVLATLRAQGHDPESVLREAVTDWAHRHPEIRELPDVGARLDAARRLLFADLDPTEVERTEDGYQFSLRTCPLASLALEYGDLCCVARSLIGSLVGQEVEQSEWILRGDPRCTFHVRTEPAHAAILAPPSSVPSEPRLATGHTPNGRSPVTFSFVGIPRDPALLRMAIGLRKVFERHGHGYQMTPEGDVRLVFNFIDPKRPRPFRRRGQGTFVISVAVTDQPVEDVLKDAYP
ncbi:MAG: winged helix-turn-helix transcriptional regulator, partial [Armatimonadetes bacterium]|nr:winged helix-turn-helix transcriptional regulator [Armatimonadota bacterium]